MEPLFYIFYTNIALIIVGGFMGGLSLVRREKFFQKILGWSQILTATLMLYVLGKDILQRVFKILQMEYLWPKNLGDDSLILPFFAITLLYLTASVFLFRSSKKIERILALGIMGGFGVFFMMVLMIVLAV